VRARGRRRARPAPRGPLTVAPPAGDWAVVAGRLLTGLAEVSHDLAVLDTAGRWVVAVTFEGDATCLRFDRDEPVGAWWDAAGPWQPPTTWTSSLGQDAYEHAVATIRRRIAAGDVYQVNVCRLLSADCDRPDLRALGAALARGNPAPYAAVVHAPSAALHLACASPELFLRRDGDVVASGPIKGTATTPQELTAKDRAENVMIVDLVRNDLGRVALTGSVDVPSLLRVEHHPGLVHLVSTVSARLRPDATWPRIFAATFPPGSVTGAPKSSSLRIVGELEPTRRGAYCGALGWVDADRRTAQLAVAIRTYEWRDGRLHLGTGAGITWGSEPRREWEETELKVRTLLEVR
jgi:para-aminobenzoate synthetase component 1